MNPGRESETAVIVCMARAAAEGRTTVTGFVDGTANELLPDAARDQVKQFRSGILPGSFRARMGHVTLQRRAKMMAVRTVAIDEALRARPCPQVVILGAGLDGRAWRMQEWKDVTVFDGGPSGFPARQAGPGEEAHAAGGRGSLRRGGLHPRPPE